MAVLELDVTFNEFAVLQLCYETLLSANEINVQLMNNQWFEDSVISSYTNWLAYLYGRIQSPRPDVMPDRREGIARAVVFGFTRIDTQAG